METTLVPALNIDVVAADHGPVFLRVSGDLDNSGCEALRLRLGGVLARGRPVVIDLTALSFLDSSGLGALLEARRRAGRLGIELRIAGQHGSVARLMRRTGTLSLLTHG